MISFCKLLCCLLLFVLSWTLVYSDSTPPLTCSVVEEVDPNLVETTFDFGEFLGGKMTVPVYVQPHVATFYKHQQDYFSGTTTTTTTKEPVNPEHNGFSAKFINLSNRDLQLFWDPQDGGRPVPMWHAPPFSCDGTSSFPTHQFLYTEFGEEDMVVKRFKLLEYPNNVYYYDPYTVDNDHDATLENLQQHLDEDELELYKILRRTVLFNDHYRNITGRSYLANFHRAPTKHYMWRADYFGQEHWVATRETHFKELPPQELLIPLVETGSERILDESEPRKLSEYRVEQDIFNMTLKVVSCSPRALEITNFLSEVEVNHILHLAAGIDLYLSGVGSDDDYLVNQDEEDAERHRTRTSYNSWVAREKSPIIDAIFRRAADLTRINECLLRTRSPDEMPDWPTSASIAEDLQLVHYDLNQEYTAHHDFGFSDADEPLQSQRFATLLLYLNEGMEGGETAFPRWVNAESGEELKITPKVGKAVLFYNQLPDGNYDDFSHHAARPVTKGEKWLINLWVSDPTREGDNPPG